MSQTEFNIIEARIHDVFVVGNRRPVDPSMVNRLATSIKTIGLHTPITVREGEVIDPHSGEPLLAYILVAGHHRLEAFKQIGFEHIPAIVRDCDEIDAQLWEISENLHRAELSALERDDQVAQWVKLRAEKVSAQTEAKPQGGRPESGVRAAARELGLEKEDARRAVKVASLSDEAKQAARTAGLDNNRSALLEAAKKATPSEQVKAIQKRAEEKKHKKTDHDDFHAQFQELPPEIVEREAAKQAAIDARRSDGDDLYNGLTAGERIAELEESLRILERECEELRAENKTFSEMRAQFQAGGYEAVIAGKDEVISGLKSRLYRESEDKASWMRSAKAWKSRAVDAGWKDPRYIEIGEQSSPDDADIPFFAEDALNG